MAAYRRVYDSYHCRLTAKNRDQLQNPTLCNRVWATFTVFYLHSIWIKVYETVWCLSVLCTLYRCSMGRQQQTRCCRFAAVVPAGRRYGSIAARPALSSSGEWMRAVPRCQLYTQTCICSWYCNSLVTKFLTWDSTGVNLPRSKPQVGRLFKLKMQLQLLVATLLDCQAFLTPPPKKN